MAGKPMADSGYQYDVPADRARQPRASGYKQRPLGPSDEDRLRWQRFLAELPERIAHIRAEEAPLLCPTCGSTTPAPVERKVCRKCHRDLPMSSFSRNRTSKDGRQFWCRWCLRPINAAQAKARRALMAVAS